jgi:hypothetical protein
MKRVLLLGIVLAIFILAMPQGVLAITNPAVPVTANVADVLECTADGGSSTAAWALVRGQDNVLSGSNGITLTVNSTFDWNLIAQDLTGSGTVGHMYDSGVLKFLNQPFMIEDDASTMTSLAGTVDIESGPPQAETTYTHDISQEVEFADYSGDGYTITVTFTCSQAVAAT